jgi:hypothetical protein
MTGSVQGSHGTYMIHGKRKAHVNVTNVTNVRAVMDHIGPMTHDRLSAEQSWGIYDP